jgi:hypothetical protein
METTRTTKQVKDGTGAPACITDPSCRSSPEYGTGGAKTSADE